MPRAYAFEIRGLTVRYGKKTVLRVDDLNCPSLGVTCLVGPSGCGKSSLLKVLAGLMDPEMSYEGSILEFGRDRAEDHTGGGAPHVHRGTFAMVWQTPIVFPCSVFSNLVIPLKKRGVPKIRRVEQIERSLEAVGLIDELGPQWQRVRADKVSGGQKQRLCIARALLQESSAIMLDEPSSALDPASTEKVEEIVASLGQERPVVLVTHNLGQARRLSSYAAVFCVDGRGGYLCEHGPAKTCLREPSTDAGRRFLRREVGL